MARAAIVALILIIIACGCASAPEYPAAWFAPLPAGVKPHAWEITPDAARAGEVIASKRTELGVFSNLAATPFELDGVRYASVEGFWQAMVFPEPGDDPRWAFGPFAHTRAEVAAMSGFEAKRAGDDAKRALRAAGVTWLSYRGRRFEPRGSDDDRRFHLALIERATRAKVAENANVRELLLATGDLVLKPDHDQGADATAAYRYCEILMRIRDEIRAKP